MNTKSLHLRSVEEKHFAQAGLRPEALASNLNGQLFAIVSEGDVALGFCALNDLNWKDRNARVALVFSTSHANKFSKEALTILSRYAFEELNLHSLYAMIDERELATVSALKACHYREVGRLVKSLCHAEDYFDKVVFNLLKEEASWS